MQIKILYSLAYCVQAKQIKGVCWYKTPCYSGVGGKRNTSYIHYLVICFAGNCFGFDVDSISLV